MKTLAEPVAPQEGQMILAVWLVFRGIERHADGSNGSIRLGPQSLLSRVPLALPVLL
jgi:hypothetical protein